MTDEPVHTALEETMAPGLFSSERESQLPIITETAKWPLHFIFSYVQSNTQNTYEGHYEKDPCKSIHSQQIWMIPITNMGRNQWCDRKLTPCTVSKDKWDTKENTGKLHEVCIVHTAVCQKAPVRLKRH